MNCKATNLHSSHRQEPRPQGVTPQKQTAGEDSLTHSIRYQERCGFCLVPSSATHPSEGRWREQCERRRGEEFRGKTCK